MPLLIDANNVLHVTGVLPPHLAGPDLAGLSALVARSRWRSDGVVFVCDGAPRPDEDVAAGHHRVLWSGPGREADAVIAEQVERSSAPRTLTVVSSDRAVTRHAARRRCRTLTAEDFLARLAEDDEIAGRRVGGKAGDAKPAPGIGPPALPPDVLAEAASIDDPGGHLDDAPPAPPRPRERARFAPGGGITRPRRRNGDERRAARSADRDDRAQEDVRTDRTGDRRRPGRGGPAGRAPRAHGGDGPLLPEDLLAEAAALEEDLRREPDAARDDESPDAGVAPPSAHPPDAHRTRGAGDAVPRDDRGLAPPERSDEAADDSGDGAAHGAQDDRRDADPLLPLDFIAEAAAIEAELRGETDRERRDRAAAEERARAEAAADAARRATDADAPTPPAPDGPPAGATGAGGVAPVLPLDFLAEAAALADAEAERRRSGRTSRRPHDRRREHADEADAADEACGEDDSSDRRDDAPASPEGTLGSVPPPRGPVLPDDVIAEAERLLGDLDDPDAR